MLQSSELLKPPPHSTNTWL